MTQSTVRFFFDFSSPYSYLASELIEPICEKHSATLLWEPMVVGGIFQADGTTPAFRTEKRNRYLMEDMQALAKFHGIPYQTRTEFLFNPILALRATLQLPQGAERSKAVHALFAGVFSKDMDMGNPENVKGQLDEAGLDGGALVEGSQQQAIKDQLRTNTEEALSMGVFGAPTYFLDGERMFWGHDRLNLLDYFLGNPEK